eukprot:TRINITY_DN14087_c0_g2_i1.p2 TRINITY_DN14087_c0_g2~~TRINITY_DN14087_c0_g2_i1.p2  ORF type:complete len:171 (+),score=8.10 TRINITY_DN14087_c0_g2_i1:13-525(+)
MELLKLNKFVSKRDNVGRVHCVSLQQNKNWRIYRVKSALVGWEPLVNMLGSNFPQQLALHTMLVMEDQTDLHCEVFDFLPAEPTNTEVIFTLLIGDKVQGTLRRKQIRKLPSKWYRLMLNWNSSKDPISLAVDYQRSYNSELKLLGNNCNTFVDGLINHLKCQSVEDQLK